MIVRPGPAEVDVRDGSAFPPVPMPACTVRRDPDLPVVSVVITNHNYGRFLGAALQSVADQTFPNVEVVVVDDASTDDSLARLAALCGPGRAYPDVKLVALERNGGQSVASAAGFAETCGAYVIFLDADDRLLPTCIESHVYVHLSSRIAVGFSAVDAINEVDGQTVSTGSEGFAAFVSSGEGRRPEWVRPIEAVAPHLWFAGREPAVPPDQIHFAPAPKADPWIWSSTSGICFRRDVLARFLCGEDLPRVRWGTDAFLMRPIAALHGSILIDRPLFVYRTHTGNAFTLSAPLARMVAFERRQQIEGLRTTIRMSVRSLFADLAACAERYQYPDVFFQAADALCRAWPSLPPERGGATYLGEQLLDHEALLLARFGPAKVDRWLRAAGVRRRFGLFGWLRGRRGRPSVEPAQDGYRSQSGKAATTGDGRASIAEPSTI